MSLSIKNPDTSALARRLADRTGESLTTAITVAVRERLDKLEREAGQERRIAELREIVRDVAPRLRDSPRSWEVGDLLYDERGLPK
jgi:antitoxin VapB